MIKRFLLIFASRVRLWVGLVFITGLVACGGGGGAGGGGTTSPGTDPNQITGQVVKGPTSGAKVSLYSLNDSGQRVLIADSITTANGTFSISKALNAGSVYLLEATGGQYKDEISGAQVQLSSPLRVVFVASASEKSFVMSAISEAVLIEIESSNVTAKWSASSVLNSIAKVGQAFGSLSPHALNYIDLPNFQPEPNAVVKDEDVAFSFQVGLFAGFWNELKFRDPAATLSSALKSFYSFTVGNSDDDRLNSIFTAGLIRIVEKIPTLNANRFQVYDSVGLPGDASVSVFAGAESSGQAIGQIPNFKLRFLNPPPFSSTPTTDTIFDSRGALSAYRLGDQSNAAGFAYVGSASIADVYGTPETAIGRWNHGYYFEQGVQVDKATGQLSTKGRKASAMTGGIVYAAAVPASDLPICGKVSMSLKAKTKQFAGVDGSAPFVLDSSSKLGFQHANGVVYVGYDILLSDTQGNTVSFKSAGGADNPGVPVEGNMEFRSFNLQLAPSGESLALQGLLAGIGGKSAVVSISSNIRTLNSYGLAGIFEMDAPIQNCITPSFSRGLVSPIPTADGIYGFSIGDSSFIVQELGFFPDGTPNFIGISGITQNSSYEKSGNDVVGIGVMAPPFSIFSAGTETKFPVIYTYRKESVTGILPTTGAATYHLIASTSFLVSNPTILISADKRIQTARLKVYFDQYPIGTVSQFYGTCQLTVNGESESSEGIFYNGGACGGSSSTAAFGGGVSSVDGRYAVVQYRKYLPPYKGDVGLLFERDLP
jgi:hypothetical protein